ncbi:MAG: response regulator [Acidobacteria bacterium]|nr:response regulator [Acidobacteriota bacterium]
MTPETRRRVIRYGIALDLVILATGVGLLFPGYPYVLLGAFIGACALAAWKGGWAGGFTAIGASVLAILSSFWGEEFDLRLLTIFAIGSLAAVALVRTMLRPRAPKTLLAEAEPTPLTIEPPPPNVVAFERTAAAEAEARGEAERRRVEDERKAAEVAAARAEGERRKALEEAAARKLEEEQREAARAEEAQRQAAQEAAARKLEEERREAARAEEERRRLEAAARKLEEERREAARAEEAARKAAEEAAARKLEEERSAEAERRRVEAEREAAALELEAERKALELERQAMEARLEAERKAAEEAAARKLEEERRALEAERAALEAQRKAVEEAAARKLAEDQRAAEEQRRALEAERAALEAQRKATEEAAAAQKKDADDTARRTAIRLAPKKPSLGQRLLGWFRPTPKPIRGATGMNLRTKKVVGNDTPRRRKTDHPQASTSRRGVARKPRLLLLEKRRGTADTIVPKLRTKGVEVEVVERWIDAIDEMFRFRPDAIFLDSELPDFEKVYRSIHENNDSLPIYLTGKSSYGFVAPDFMRYVSFITRPYDTEAVLQIAHKAMNEGSALIPERRAQPRPLVTTPAPRRPEPPPAPVVVRPAPAPVASSYSVACFHCRVIFDAVEADWCSCLTKERTLVCTNCLTCFCKAAPAYKEKFWVEAPPKLFERKSSEARRAGGLPPNLEPDDVARPLILAVEDDEDIQSIVQRVCQNLGYGFIYALNGQDGLDLAHQYRPNLILSDAFMPKLDGREMCRMLKEEPSFRDTRMVVMTGLYTDTKYRSEALKRFHVDDYLAKPVAVTDLINLLQKHLEGVADIPPQEDLHERYRAQVEEVEEDVPLAELLEEEEDEPRMLALRAAPEPMPTVPRPEPRDGYEICCFNCQQLFDATAAEWCHCVGRDNTLVCPQCQGCFCKAPAAYRERFWMDAPPSLFERKMIGSRRAIAAGSNPSPHEVKRPLILLVEDDENVQLIVRTVVTSMGYGFIAAANGQEGLLLAHEYRPDLILSDAFMPKLDGREMCRLLKEDPATAVSKAIIMTGLYTDRKYRNEALDYFKVDDYVAKPLAVDDLIKLFKKHLPQEVHATM